jgi:hypothetical protein
VPKWLIVVLVVIAMLFVISLAAGSNQDRTSRSGFGASLKGLERKSRLDVAHFDLTVPECRTDNSARIEFDSGCILRLGETGRFRLSVREARIGVENGPVEFTLDPASDSPTQSDEVGQADDEEFTFEREGGTLALACKATNGAPCTVVFLPLRD